MELYTKRLKYSRTRKVTDWLSIGLSPFVTYLHRQKAILPKILS